MIINNIPILILSAIILVYYLIYVVKHLIILLLVLDLLMLILILLLIENIIYNINYGYSLIILSLAASDTAVGLGLFISFYKITGQTTL